MSKTISSQQCHEIVLAEANGKVNPEVQILRTGKFKHPKYGEFEITPQTLSEMKSNFDKRVRGIDIAFDYFHDSDKEAAGWPKELELRNNDTELWAKNVEWTPRARQMLSDKELRYFSPDFAFQWTDTESGTTFNNVLFGGGLTNRPFLKEMEPLVQLSEETIQKIARMLSEIKLADVTPPKVGVAKTEPNKGGFVDEKDKMIEELKKEIAALKAKYESGGMEMQAVKDENAKLCDENKALKEKMHLAEREAAFNVMLSEGKTCVAQKEAYLKNDMEQFIKLAQPLNMTPKGNSEDPSKADLEDRILKLAEEKMKADATLDVGVAFSLAKKELKK